MATTSSYETDLQKLLGFKPAYTINGSLLNLSVATMQLLEDDLRANAEFVNGVLTTHAAILKAGGAAAAQLQKAHAVAVKALQWYLKKREDMIQEVTVKSAKQLADAQTRAQQAVDKKQAGMFTQVDKSLNEVKNMLEHVRTMDYSVAKELNTTVTKNFADATAAVTAAKTAMREQLLAATSAPVDLYTDTDKEEIRDMVTQAWKKKYPKDDILGVRFPNKTWVRDSVWRWSSADKGWSNNDTSVLRLAVIVKTDKTVATIYQAYVNRDNASDSVNVGVDTKGNEYVVEEMLLENWK